MSSEAARELAWTAAALLAVDPTGLGGAHLVARPGAELDAWTRALRGALDPHPLRRVPAHVDLGRLTGDLDLAASIRTGRRVALRGILEESDGGVLLLPMAERTTREVAGALAEALDNGRVTPRLPGLPIGDARVGLVLVDESREDEPGVPELLAERVGLRIVLPPRSPRDPAPPQIDPDRVARARAALPGPTASPEQHQALVTLALRLGLPSLRAPIQAMRAARVHAVWRDPEAEEIGDDDLAAAAALVLLPQAREAPAAESSPPEPPPEVEDGSDTPDDPGDDDPVIGALEEQVIEAAQAFLPDEVEAEFAAARVRASGRRGEKLRQLLHGHRVGARPGDPRRGGRVDLTATLRAAAPWQRVRARAEERERGKTAAVGSTEGGALTSEAARPADEGGRIRLRMDDLHMQLRMRRAATATVFVVDASGSQALNRLAEVKGAVELFLSESYVRRDQVALVTFGGAGARVAVPPTRSLARARALLQGLPGGGGTPLAAGLEEGFRVALRLQATEAAPRIVVLTDGRPNVGLDGAGGRAAAREDALTISRGIARSGLPVLVLDTSARGEPFARDLATALGGVAYHLPRPDARGLSASVGLLDTLSD